MKFRTIGPYRFFFTTNDRDEPPHIHVERDGIVAKFWLNPVRVARPSRFPEHELRRIERLVEEYHRELIEAWNEFLSR